jgi:hypothetical protein
MGTAELTRDIILVRSNMITYGNAATPAITEQIRDEIETMWNEPHGYIELDHRRLLISFEITAEHMPGLTDMAVYSNLNPCNNYIRIEEFAVGNISFVDGIGCNSGYFKLENLYKGSTTAAHEYGHTIGLDHPRNTDLRGKGVPGIMYPRGTLVDPQYQYDPSKPAGVTGGTMHPMHRKVQQADIALLKIEKHDFREGILVLGAFTNYWHPDHRGLAAGDSL